MHALLKDEARLLLLVKRAFWGRTASGVAARDAMGCAASLWTSQEQKGQVAGRDGRGKV